jgi:hypothetical protein
MPEIDSAQNPGIVEIPLILVRDWLSRMRHPYGVFILQISRLKADGRITFWKRRDIVHGNDHSRRRCIPLPEEKVLSRNDLPLEYHLAEESQEKHS